MSTVIHLTGFAIAYQWGIVAIAWAYLIRRALILPVGQWAVHKLILFSWRTYLKQFVAPMVASGVMVVAVTASKLALMDWQCPTVLLVGACTVVGVLVYIACVRIMAPRLYDQVTELLRSVVTTGASGASANTLVDPA